MPFLLIHFSPRKYSLGAYSAASTILGTRNTRSPCPYGANSLEGGNKKNHDYTYMMVINAMKKNNLE